MRAILALTEGLFDYAGLFPPAALPFSEMLREAAGHKDTLHRPQLIATDMVVTVERLNELSAQHLLEAGFRNRDHVRICLVGVDAKDGAKQANQLLSFNREARVDAVPHEVVTLELHSDLAAEPMDTAGALMPARFVVAGQDIRVYWEPKLTDAEWQARMDEVFAVIDGANQEVELPILGLKVRCAGEYAVAPATMARIIVEINKRSIPFKATQGLHHPLASDDFPIGFIGLAAALRMNESGDLQGSDIAACLAERDPAAFRFDDGIEWRDHELPARNLGHAVRVPFQIGSCSIREPDAELAELWPVATT
jgi:hypothetical protein